MPCLAALEEHAACRLPEYAGKGSAYAYRCSSVLQVQPRTLSARPAKTLHVWHR